MAIKLDPNNSEPYYNKGIAEILLGQNQKGCEDLKKAKALGHDRAQEMIIRFCK
ncbi:MAG: tetratricopeptide repeat protein [Bacteroidetes bacterium]|nr:tetratricopeptide repeat protein [Bacteroidota bacterium]